MNKCRKLTALGIFSVLTIAMASPMMAHAGTLTIYNKNCTKTANFATKKRVAVHVYPKEYEVGCVDDWFIVRKGSSRTVEISKHTLGGLDCGKYRHEAPGTIFGKWDVDAAGDSHVTCKKDWLGVCQCTKD